MQQTSHLIPHLCIVGKISGPLTLLFRGLEMSQFLNYKSNVDGSNGERLEFYLLLHSESTGRTLEIRLESNSQSNFEEILTKNERRLSTLDKMISFLSLLKFIFVVNCVVVMKN